jgi:hypothetical protein
MHPGVGFRTCIHLSLFAITTKTALTSDPGFVKNSNEDVLPERDDYGLYRLTVAREQILELT